MPESVVQSLSADWDSTGLPSWVLRFLEKTELRGAGEASLKQYLSWFRALKRHGLIDLRTIQQNDLLSNLTKLKRQYSERHYVNLIVLIKGALRFLKRENLADAFDIPKITSDEERIKDKLLTPDEIKKMITQAPSLQDRLMIEMFYELGGRRGELFNAKVKSIQFDQYGAIITLTGKSGTRRRRLYSSVPDLRAHINNHPLRDNPEAPLFLSRDGRALSNFAIYYRVHKLGETILKKKIHPHMFRHTRATEDSKYFTDRELMQLFGWKSPRQVGIYSHLSMKEVEDHDLVLHGLKAKEEILRPLSQIQSCTECKEENAPIAVYCVKCGAILPQARPEQLTKIVKENQDLHARLVRLEGQFETILKTKFAD
jgi:integrase/recombinase XerD